jgi:hypothetical protein
MPNPYMTPWWMDNQSPAVSATPPPPPPPPPFTPAFSQFGQPRAATGFGGQASNFMGGGFGPGDPSISQFPINLQTMFGDQPLTPQQLNDLYEHQQQNNEWLRQQAMNEPNVNPGNTQFFIQGEPDITAGPGGAPNNQFDLPTGGATPTPPPSGSQTLGSPELGGDPMPWSYPPPPAVTNTINPTLFTPEGTPSGSGPPSYPAPPGVDPAVASPTRAWSPFGNGISAPPATTPWGAPTNYPNVLNIFRNLFTTDPTPNIAPGGSPVGSFTPDPVASGIPLPGATFNLGNAGGTIAGFVPAGMNLRPSPQAYNWMFGNLPPGLGPPPSYQNWAAGFVRPSGAAAPGAASRQTSSGRVPGGIQ